MSKKNIFMEPFGWRPCPQTNILCAVCLAFALLSLPVYSARGAEDITELPHYLDEYKVRYASYIEKNPDMPYARAVAYVNAGVDKEPYNEITAITEPASLLVLCNKNFSLPADYVPADLVSVGGTYKLRGEAARQYELMKAEASLSGFNFTIYSAYRSYNSQKYLYESYFRRSGSFADSYSARAGHSEHQTGLAVDILQKPGFYSMGAAKFQNTGEYKWLTQNAYKYGFILRYPYEYNSVTGYTFEPWHWRYVGVRAATEMYDNNIAAFEEYCGRYLIADGTDSDHTEYSPALFAFIAGGEAFVTEAYLIDGSYIFKLRDIAYMLKNTDYRFGVEWDADSSVISLTSMYEPPDSEILRTGEAHEPSAASVELVLDGERLETAVYDVCGNSFVSLLEISPALGFEFIWDDDIIYVK